jgi:hypothetical protein
MFTFGILLGSWGRLLLAVVETNSPHYLVQYDAPNPTKMLRFLVQW